MLLVLLFEADGLILYRCRATAYEYHALAIPINRVYPRVYDWLVRAGNANDGSQG